MTDWNLVSSICKEMLFGKYFRIGIVFGVNIGLFIFNIGIIWVYVCIIIALFIIVHIWIVYWSTRSEELTNARRGQFSYSMISSLWTTRIIIDKEWVSVIILTVAITVAYVLYIRVLYKRALSLRDYIVPINDIIVVNDYIIDRRITDTVYQCSVCLDDIVDNKVRLNNCLHVFHKPCIDSWLIRQRTCPNCRTSTIISSSTLPL